MPQQALRTAPPAAESVEVVEVKTQETHQAPQRGNAVGIPGHQTWLAGKSPHETEVDEVESWEDNNS